MIMSLVQGLPLIIARPGSCNSPAQAHDDIIFHPSSFCISLDYQILEIYLNTNFVIFFRHSKLFRFLDQVVWSRLSLWVLSLEIFIRLRHLAGNSKIIQPEVFWCLNFIRKNFLKFLNEITPALIFFPEWGHFHNLSYQLVWGNGFKLKSSAEILQLMKESTWQI